LATFKSLRVRELVLVLCLSLAACGGPVPDTTVGPSGSGAATAGPSGSAGPSFVPFDQATMVDAAQAEVDEVQRLRAEAGIAALIGPAGPKVFANVDAAKVENAAKTLPMVAAELGLDLAAVAPRIASVRLPAPAPRTRDDIEWTGSLVGQVSATTSMMMALLPTAIANLAGRSADARGGAPIDHTETYTPAPHDGVSEKVTIRTRVRVTAGGGRVALDIDINSVDTISDTATGQEISRLEGNAHGHLDVNGCPDIDGVAEGSYELSLQEELVKPGSSGAGDVKVVKAPFRLIDGDDAHLTRIEGNLDITAHAHGPGAAGGDPFDWTVGATVSETIPVSGGTTAGAPAIQTNGDPTQAQVDKTVGGRRSAEDYLKVLGKETEKFWRSGECIKLKPSRDSGKVKPEEEIKLSVDSLGAFDGKQITAKIKAAFTGKESLDPKDTPIDPPAVFNFKAGKEKDDKGTIDLLQTGKRGIGKKKVEFTVDLPQLQAAIEATVHQDNFGNVYDTAIHLKKLDLVSAQDGTSTATATVSWTTTYKPPTADCETKTYTGTFKTEVTARLDPADPTRVLVKASFIPGVLKQETLKCAGKSFPFTGGTTLGVWAFLGTEHAVSIGGSATIHPAIPGGGTSSVTVTITKKSP
jgi:hypothetical protein